jgi:hypothetical protein
MKRTDETEAERKRRIAIFLMLRNQEKKKPPRRTTIAQEHDLFKAREARREARHG